MDRLGLVGGLYSSARFKERKKKIREKSGILSFRRELKGAEDSQRLDSLEFSGTSAQQKVELLLADVESMGESLKRDSSLVNLQNYKRAVRSFYSHIISQSYKANPEEGRIDRQSMARKQYTLIAVIDKNLEKLGAEVIRAQKDQLLILERMEEIHGLLVDLMR